MFLSFSTLDLLSLSPVDHNSDAVPKSISSGFGEASLNLGWSEGLRNRDTEICRTAGEA